MQRRRRASAIGMPTATSLALVTHRNRTALISLGIPKLVRFHKIHRQCSFTVFYYLYTHGALFARPRSNADIWADPA
jgi:hypothetical protein